jgi:hypothetical protein
VKKPTKIIIDQVSGSDDTEPKPESENGHNENAVEEYKSHTSYNGVLMPDNSDP